MALSNLRNEPRREITEQIAGAVFVIVFGFIDYGIAIWLGMKNTFDIVLMMMVGACGLIFAGLFLTVVLHELGEVVCDWLKQIGADPRPKRRF